MVRFQYTAGRLTIAVLSGVIGFGLTAPTAHAGFSFTPPPPTAEISSDHTMQPAPVGTVDKGGVEQMPWSVDRAPPAPGTVQGFGHDIPLTLALHQIVPAEYHPVLARNVSSRTHVTWSGDKPWQDVLQDALAPAGLTAVVDGTEVRVEKTNAPAADNAVAADDNQPAKLQPVSGKYTPDQLAAIGAQQTNAPTNYPRHNPDNHSSVASNAAWVPPAPADNALPAAPATDMAPPPAPPMAVITPSPAAAPAPAMPPPPPADNAAVKPYIVDANAGPAALSQPPVAEKKSLREARDDQSPPPAAMPMTVASPPKAEIETPPAPKATAAPKASAKAAEIIPPAPAATIAPPATEPARIVMHDVPPSSTGAPPPPAPAPEDLAAPVSMADAMSTADAATPPGKMDAAPVAAAPVKAEPPRGLNMQAKNVWKAQSGEGLHRTLSVWCLRAGVKLDWQAKQDFALAEPLNINGTFAEGVAQLLTRFNDAQPRPVGNLKPSQADGSALLTITNP